MIFMTCYECRIVLEAVDYFKYETNESHRFETVLKLFADEAGI
jgi:hypothetical protein